MNYSRVLLADGYRLLREAVARLLEPVCKVVGSVGDGRALLEAAPQLRPDIIVLDTAMPLLNGLDAARQLTRSMPQVRLIFLTANEDLAREVFEAGASGYVLKTSAASELIQAIREVAAGRCYVTPLATRELVDNLMRRHESPKKAAELSPRQREVLQLVVEGRRMKEIARILKITPRTVAFHKYGIMEAVGVKSSAQLVRLAIREQVVSA